jgi:ferric-dicitrate binding protein FerR (iron transport regulator)
MQPQQKRRVFAKFLAGISSVEDDKFLLHTPEVKSMMQEQWDEHIPEDLQKPDLYRILALVYRRIVSSKISQTKTIPLKRIILRRVFTAAAIIIMLISVGSTLWFTGIIPGKDMVTISATKGVRAEVFLPDGSRVWLNSGSKLKYNKKFDQSNRQLWLEGEAFFNISHNPARPLLVHTQTATVEVLGTRFNLVSLHSFGKWEATLVSGSIKIIPSQKNENAQFKLQPNQKAFWNHNSNQFQVENVDTDRITRWVSNQLKFDNESFAVIARQLEQTFGVQIDIPKNIAETYYFTATFTDESIYEIFNLLKITAPIDFSVKGNRVIVFQKPLQ